jgi:hypothetical protein
MYSSTLSLSSALDESGWSTPRPGRFNPGKDPSPILWRLGGSQGRSVQLRNITSPTGFRSPDRPACNEPLYRLSCPGPRTMWVASPNTGVDGWRKMYIRRSCQKHACLSLLDLSAGRHLLGDSFVTSLKSNLRTVVTTHNTTEHACVIRQTNKQADPLQPDVLLTFKNRASYI